MKFSGSYLYFRVTSAEPAKLISRLSDTGIVLSEIETAGALTIYAKVEMRYYPKLKSLVSETGGSIEILQQKSAWGLLLCLLKRPVMLAFVAILMAAMIWVPTRIFFVEVEGNVQIPEKMIEEYASQCGIRFGASRKAVRSEKSKNQLLTAIPQLQWAGVNTRGCVAVISVKEKPQERTEIDRISAVSSIIAERDGVIHSCTAIKGNLLCKVGQAVKAGETLISAYTDCGITIQATRAEGEIMAFTQRNIRLVSPVPAIKRGALACERTRIGIRLGKKLIFFCKDSGISPPSCVKMYSENYVTLPGGFALPVSLIQEKSVQYQVQPVDAEDIDFSWVPGFARRQLGDQMLAGQILSEYSNGILLEDTYQWYGQFACIESIGQRRSEEILPNHGEDS